MPATPQAVPDGQGRFVWDTYMCRVCGKPNAGPSLLERHMRTHTGERPFKCDLCNKGFTTKENMRRHRKVHYSENHQNISVNTSTL